MRMLRPGRCLEDDCEDQVREMTSTMFHFEAGARTYIGKGISSIHAFCIILLTIHVTCTISTNLYQ